MESQLDSFKCGGVVTAGSKCAKNRGFSEYFKGKVKGKIEFDVQVTVHRDKFL